jgi:hypothetical protein
MMTRTAALAGQQQARPGMSAGDATGVAVPGSRRTTAVFFLAAGCRCLAFMASASPARRTTRKRRTSLHPVLKVPHLGPWPAYPARGFLQVATGLTIALELADCPDRRLGHAAAELAAAEAAAPGTHVTVVLPRRSYPPLTGRLLHDHTADRIARRVSRVPGAAATIIPFDVRHKVETIHARRTRAAAHREQDPPAGADPIGSAPAGPPSRAGCTRRRSARAGTTAACWRARSPTRPAS